ncbi:MAG: hypothetical protein QM749_18220 [Aquabacterium sp.]
MGIKHRPLVCFLAVLACALAGSANAAPSYAFSVLGGGSFAATGVNDAGVVVGSAWTGTGLHAAAWDGATFTYLDPANSNATAVNNAGVVTGGYVLGDGNNRAAVWNGASMTTLQTDAYASDVNDAGVVAGYAYGVVPGVLHNAVTWQGGTMTVLPTTAPGQFSTATSINNAGVVVGSINNIMSDPHAVVWHGDVVTDLSVPLGGETSVATGINNADAVVGWAFLAGQPNVHGVLWSGDNALDLGTLPGYASSVAAAINDAGVIVGSSRPDAVMVSGERAVMWVDGQIIDLNSLLSAQDIQAGWVLTEAAAINSAGMIVGTASNTLTSQIRGFVLSPVPEPSVGLLMVLGTACLSVHVRRQRRRV